MVIDLDINIITKRRIDGLTVCRDMSGNKDEYHIRRSKNNGNISHLPTSPDRSEKQ
jgi:hypothetical protein